MTNHEQNWQGGQSSVRRMHGWIEDGAQGVTRPTQIICNLDSLEKLNGLVRMQCWLQMAGYKLQVAGLAGLPIGVPIALDPTESDHGNAGGERGASIENRGRKGMRGQVSTRLFWNSMNRRKLPRRWTLSF